MAVAAVIVPDGDLPASKEAAARTLREHCREVLAAYKVPRRFVFVDAAKLPATSTGKLQRNRLNELFGDPGDQ